MTEPYFRYFPPAPETSTWGICVSGAGFAVIGKNQAYPPNQHPADHYFTWDRGRVLESMQILLVSDGTGWFESRHTGRVRVDADSAFVLLPGIWHRYQPDEDTGWTESWCEFRGPLVEQLVRDRVLTEESPLRGGAVAWGLEEAMDSLHRRVRNKQQPGFDAQLSALAMRVLAIWSDMGRPAQEPTKSLQAVAQAERYIAEHLSDSIDLEALAQRSGVAYSHFRRLFRAATGYSPWQYVIHLRLEMGRRMLASGDATLREISESLGFSSAFHFSSAFKSSFGSSPTRWRKAIRSAHGQTPPVAE
jgi:AraC-like DNA-binding protein